MSFLTALSTKLHRILVSSGYETNHQRSTKAGHGEFHGCIYPKMEDNLYGTITIKSMKVFQGYWRLANIRFYS